MRFLVPIDLTQNELQNARVQNLPAAPDTPEPGQIYYNSNTNVLNFWNGSAWVATGDISQASIDALSDVTITSIQDRQFLVYDSQSSAWINSTVGLGDLDDVDVSQASSGQALVYDGQDWKPATVSFTLDGLLDVDILTPAAGEVLYFDGEDWINQQLDTDDIVEGSNLFYTDQRADDRIAAADIEDLNNVSGGATDGQVFQYNENAAVWEPVDLSSDDVVEGTTNLFYTDERVENVVASSSLDDLSDVNVPTANVGDALVFDGEDWVADSTTFQATSEKGQADGYAPLGADTKLPPEFLPDLAITQTFVVADLEERDLLDVQEGDVAVVTSTGEAYIFAADGEGGTWVLLGIPGAGVLSVGGIAPISSTGGRNPDISLDSNGITETYLADNAVTTAKIAANAVTSTEIAANAVTSTELAANAVITVNITDANVTEAKLDANLVSKINAKTDRYAETIGDNTATSFVISHGFDTRDVQVYVYETADDRAQVFADVEHTSTSSVTVKFAQAPETDEYRVVVVG